MLQLSATFNLFLSYVCIFVSGFTSGTNKQPVFLHNKMSDAYDKACDIPGDRLDKMRKRDPTEYMNAMHPDNHSRSVEFHTALLYDGYVVSYRRCMYCTPS